METQEVTYHVKLVARDSDPMGYINYVFENLEYDSIDNHYIMCVRFPNWEQSSMDIDDVGYVHIKYVEAGISKWYDGNEFTPYKQDNIVFIKFIHEKKKFVGDEIVLD